MNDLHQLSLLVQRESGNLLSQWRQQVRELPSARHLDIPTLNDHMPSILDELAVALESDIGQTIPKSLQEENANLEADAGLKLERRNFDLWPLVESLIHDLHPLAATSGTRLINAIPEELVVFADAGLLRRVFQNLIANAIKYAPRDEVTIGAFEQIPDKTIDCWVSDNGVGIFEPLLDKIFEKGENDPKSDGGLGLGLAIVKAFTEASGGKVTVESLPGVGSTFRFSLPTKTSASC